MAEQLSGKVAIITGAGSGIGRASALRFAAEGARLVLGDKTEAVHATARAVQEAGGQAVALQIDAGLEAMSKSSWPPRCSSTASSTWPLPTPAFRAAAPASSS